MDEMLGYARRMGKVANNLRKFGMLKEEKAKLSIYHTQIIKDGLDLIAKEGIIKYCKRLGELNGVSGDTDKSDYAIMKRYRVVK